ncbi:hypothetical protein [Caenispirillum salinarum]|uniref:hypothetical protein n=1 Tax=Caenispirillum salinarum TaxID=859058 RepID=UPI00385018AD
MPLRDMPFVLDRLDWMRAQGIWPNGLRYLWTDAFGVVLLVSLYEETGDRRWIDEAEALVDEVDRVLGRRRGYRIGEAPDRDGQYFHYLAMWMFAMARLGDVMPAYREKGVAIAKAVHKPFVIPGTGVVWKMEEDLGRPYPGYGLGALDAFDGYVSYRLLDETALADEIAEMRGLMDRTWPDLHITQDLGIGMMLWMAGFFPREDWAKAQVPRCLSTLDQMWVDPPGYFCRQPGTRDVKFAFTNYGVTLGLQAQDTWPDRVERTHTLFDAYRSGDHYDRDAITHVMACVSHLPGAMLPHGG